MERASYRDQGRHTLAPARGNQQYNEHLGERAVVRAPVVPVPLDGGGAAQLLPPQEGGLPADRPRRHPRRRPQQARAMGHPREMQDRFGPPERLVLLQPQGQEVPEGDAHEPRHHRRRLLEGHRPRQGHLQRRQAHLHAQDARLLQGPRAARPEVRLDHARVPPRRPYSCCCRPATRPPMLPPCCRWCGQVAAAAAAAAASDGGQEDGWVVCRVFKKKHHHKESSGGGGGSKHGNGCNNDHGHGGGKAAAAAAVAHQHHGGGLQYSSSDDALDQILQYMGRSCKQEHELLSPPPAASAGRAASRYLRPIETVLGGHGFMRPVELHAVVGFDGGHVDGVDEPRVS